MRKNIRNSNNPFTFNSNCQSDIAGLTVFGKSYAYSDRLLNTRGYLKQGYSKDSKILLDLKGFDNTRDVFSVKSFNIWDEEWKTGVYNISSGAYTEDTTRICSKNLIEVEPGCTYSWVVGNGWVIYFSRSKTFLSAFNVSEGTTFTVPDNCYYIHLDIAGFYGNVYHNDICINKSDPYIDGLYIPHSAKYFIIRRLGRLDLASLPFVYDTSYYSTRSKHRFYVEAPSDMKIPANNDTVAKLLCATYTTRSINSMHTSDLLGIGVAGTNSRLYVYTGSASIKPTGWLDYELASPIIEYLDTVQFRQLSGSNSFVFELVRRLPSGFQELEYIESHGTEYINTGCIPSLSTKVEVDLMLSTITPNDTKMLFGSNNVKSGDTTKEYFQLYLNTLGNIVANIGETGGQTLNVTIGAASLNRGKVILENDSGNYTGTAFGVTNTGVIDGFISSSTMYLFARNNGGSPENNIAMKVYECIIDVDGKRKRDFIPCYRKSDGVIGLFDIVNNVFYTNQGTGTFAKGPEVCLPEEYQQVDYIESTGTQYIDTGYVSNSSTNASAKFSITQYQQEGNNILSSGDGNYQNRTFLITTRNETNGYKFRIGYGTHLINSDVTCELDTLYNVETLISSSTKALKVNDTIVCSDDFSETFTSEEMTIFAVRNNVVVRYLTAAKLYSLRINEGIVKKNFIPCYHKQTGEIGMYDLVSGTFFTNQGTGTFLKGSDINLTPEISLDYFYNSLSKNSKNIISLSKPSKIISSIRKNNNLIYEKVNQLPSIYQEVEYLESHGTEYIDTGVKATVNSGISIDYSYTANGNAGVSGFYQPDDPRTDTLFVTTLSGQTDSEIELISRGASFNTETMSALNVKYNAKINYLNDGLLLFNNTKSHVNGTNGVISNRNLILFGRDRSGSYAFSNVRIYNSKVTEGNSIIRSFIPCFRKSDGKPGLYDAVNNVFYTNQGTGEFSVGPSIIPDAYQRVSYIQSTGTQYIDTGWIPSSDVEARLKFVPTDASGIQIILAGAGPNDIAYCLLGHNSNFSFFNQAGNPFAYVNTAYQVGTMYETISKNQGNNLSITVNGTNAVNYGTTVVSTVSQKLFVALTAAGEYYYFAKIKLYSCRLIKEGVVERDFVPCYRKSDFKPGLYDTITGQFFTNQGTGEFLFPIELPEDYQQVEYIQSSGTQYIDTGKKNTGTMYGKFNMSILDNSDSKNCSIFGAFDPETYDRTYINGTGGSNPYWQFGYGDANNYFIGSNVEVKDYYIYCLWGTRKQKLEINGNVELSKTADVTRELTRTCMLFKVNGTDFCGIIRLYSATIGLDDNDIRLFIPCYNKFTNEIGLYDIITNTFFNNKGTGTFIKGSNM